MGEGIEKGKTQWDIQPEHLFFLFYMDPLLIVANACHPTMDNLERRDRLWSVRSHLPPKWVVYLESNKAVDAATAIHLLIDMHATVPKESAFPPLESWTNEKKDNRTILPCIGLLVLGLTIICMT